MLSSIRKFSGSIYAKIFLFIVILPFVFWGMGPVFTGGSKNVIVKIDKKKISVQEFNNFIKNNVPLDQKIDEAIINRLLSNFIGEKLIALEVNSLNINVSDKSLSKVIKNQKNFKRKNVFSRTEYEKFLINNNLDAVTFEKNMMNQIKKDQLFEFIGGGIYPPKFLVNLTYNSINQKRYIELINLNNFFNKKLNFTEAQINEYFKNNSSKFNDIHKSVKFIKLNPKNLTGSDDFDNLFFQKIDEIDDLIVEGKNLDYLLTKYNLGNSKSKILIKSVKDNTFIKDDEFSSELINDIFKLTDSEPIVLKEENNEFFIIELSSTNTVKKNLSNESVKKEILLNLKKTTKRKFLSQIVDKINNDNYKKGDFDKFSKEENLTVDKITLTSASDDKIIKQELVNQIYKYPENRVIVVFDMGLNENFLIYIDKIENVKISKSSDEYKKYLNLAKVRITSGLYNSYDLYLKNKYEIEINYKALDTIKNYIE